MFWQGSKFIASRAPLRINQGWCFANVWLYASWATFVVLSVGCSSRSLDMNRIMNSEVRYNISKTLILKIIKLVHYRVHGAISTMLHCQSYSSTCCLIFQKVSYFVRWKNVVRHPWSVRLNYRFYLGDRWQQNRTGSPGGNRICFQRKHGLKKSKNQNSINIMFIMYTIKITCRVLDRLTHSVLRRCLRPWSVRFGMLFGRPLCWTFGRTKTTTETVYKTEKSSTCHRMVLSDLKNWLRWQNPIL